MKLIPIAVFPLLLLVEATAQQVQTFDVEFEQRSAEDGPTSVAGTVLGAGIVPDAARENVYTGSDFGCRYEAVVTDSSATFRCARGEGPLSDSIDGERNRGTWVFEKALPLGDNQGDVYLRPTEEGLKMSVGCRSLNYLHATIGWDGREHHVIVADMDWSGGYEPESDYWTFVSDDELQAREKGYSSNSLLELVESHYQPRSLVEVRCLDVGDRMATIVIGPSGGSRSREDSFRRRHHRLMERFVERSGDSLAQRIEEGRDRTEEAIEWRYVFNAEELDALVAESDKPLLVDGETDWCHWCHVMDATTMKDREVYDRVRANFLPVKANFDFATKDLERRLGVRAYPTYLVVTADGVAHRGAGFQPPEAFLAFLSEGAERASKD
ncbi:MAG: thioredoxin family protein [Planctomycetota bacterium]